MLRAAFRKRTDEWVPALALALASASLWVPFGLSVGGTVEEWLLLDQFHRGMSPFVLHEHLLRPLAYLQTYLAFIFTPGSFVGLNLLHMFYIWGKGMALYLILRDLGARSSLGLAAAVLFILYPADTGQMTLRTTGIHLHVMCFLISLWLLLKLGKQFRFGLAFATVASLTICLLLYEPAYPLAAVSPFLLLVQGRRPSRHAIDAALLWYATLAVLVGRYIFVFLSERDTYQVEILASEQGIERWSEMVRYLGGAYARVLWVGWREAFDSLRSAGTGDLLLGILVALCVGGAIVVVGWQEGERTGPNSRSFLICLAGAALVIVALAFAPYLPTHVRAATWRTFFFPAIGGGLLVAVVLRVLCLPRSPRSRVPFALATGFVTLICFVHLLAQHRGFAEVSWNQQRLLGGVLREVPSIGEEVRLIVVFDEGVPAAISPSAFHYSRYFRAALAYLYGAGALNAQVCYPFVLRRGERCELDGDGVTIEHEEPEWLEPQLEWEVGYQHVLALERDKEGRVSLLETIPEWYSLQPEGVDYRPRALLETAGGERVRRAKLLRVEPVPRSESAPPKARRQTHVEMEFSEGKCFGAGWSAPRVTAAGLTYRFMPYQRAALHFPLQARDYRFELRIANGISVKLLGSLRLSVSGRSVPLERVVPGGYRGEISQDLVPSDGDTILLFQVDVEELASAQREKGPLVGLGFDWLRIVPLDEAGGDEAERPFP